MSTNDYPAKDHLAWFEEQLLMDAQIELCADWGGSPPGRPMIHMRYRPPGKEFGRPDRGARWIDTRAETLVGAIEWLRSTLEKYGGEFPEVPK
jgi:hypothetical protein